MSIQELEVSNLSIHQVNKFSDHQDASFFPRSDKRNRVVYKAKALKRESRTFPLNIPPIKSPKAMSFKIL